MNRSSGIRSRILTIVGGNDGVVNFKVHLYDPSVDLIQCYSENLSGPTPATSALKNPSSASGRYRPPSHSAAVFAILSLVRLTVRLERYGHLSEGESRR